MGALVFALCWILRFLAVCWLKFDFSHLGHFIFFSYVSNLGLSCWQGKFVAEAMSVIAANTDAL